MNLERSVDVRFGAHTGLKSDNVRGPKSAANTGSRGVASGTPNGRARSRLVTRSAISGYSSNNCVRRRLTVIRFSRVPTASAAMNQTIRFCTTPDDTRLAYAVSGEGPPLVMSATWLTHLEHQWRSLAWRPWLDAFTSEHSVLRYDSRGCGLSDRNTNALSFETWVRDFECVIEAADFRRFALVATCWGGPIAIEYAVRHPERVSHLVLYGTYARGRLRRTDRPSEIEKARVLLELTRLGWAQEDHAFLQVWASKFQPGGTLEHLRSWCEQQRAATSADTAVRLLQIDMNVDVTETARKIACPVLMVHPERDAVVPI